MDVMISALLSRFERGTLSRRELIEGLPAQTAVEAAGQAQPSSIKATKIDHISIQINDLSRSVGFYQKMAFRKNSMGLPFMRPS